MMTDQQLFDEKKEIRQIEKELQQWAKLFWPFFEINPDSGTDRLERIEKIIRKLPSGETVVQDLEELKARAIRLVETARNARSRAYKQIESAYLQKCISEGKTVREVHNGWRIGPLLLERRDSVAQFRFLYNREPLTKWQYASRIQDFEKKEKEALSLLDKYSLPPDDLVDIFWDAYQHALLEGLGGDSGSVPILDFYREVRIALVRRDLQGQHLGKKLTFPEFPMWAFLYNLDRYRGMGSEVRRQRELGLQTGSQREVAEKKGVVVNGLFPEDDYKVMCYVYAVNDTSPAD